MFTLSQILHQPVYDNLGAQIGYLAEVIVSNWVSERYPVVTAITVQRNAEQVIIGFADVSSIDQAGARLKPVDFSADRYSPANTEVSLVSDVLDQEVISRIGAQMARVNDLKLEWMGQRLVVTQILTGMDSLLYRLGLGEMATTIASRFHHAFPVNGLAAADIVVMHPKLLDQDPQWTKTMHPVDLAKLFEQLLPVKWQFLLDRLSIGQIASVLEIIDPNLQSDLFFALPETEQPRVVEYMTTSQAAIFLQSLTEDAREDILRLLNGRVIKDIQEVMGYPRQTAGSLMMLHDITLAPEWTVEQALRVLHNARSKRAVEPSIYVVNMQNRLIGALSLSQLIGADPDQPVTELMRTQPIFVEARETQKAVARRMIRYGLVDIPVVDQQHHLLGVIPFENAIPPFFLGNWNTYLSFLLFRFIPFLSKEPNQ